MVPWTASDLHLQIHLACQVKRHSESFAASHLHLPVEGPDGYPALVANLNFDHLDEPCSWAFYPLRYFLARLRVAFHHWNKHDWGPRKPRNFAELQPHLYLCGMLNLLHQAVQQLFLGVRGEVDRQL